MKGILFNIKSTVVYISGTEWLIVALNKFSNVSLGNKYPQKAIVMQQLNVHMIKKRTHAALSTSE